MSVIRSVTGALLVLVLGLAPGARAGAQIPGESIFSNKGNVREGWLVRGPEALDSLAAYSPRMGSYLATIIDFDASGSMAYVYASVRYQYAGAKGRQYRDLEATIVLFQRGDQWKVRSYLERPRLDPENP